MSLPARIWRRVRERLHPPCPKAVAFTGPLDVLIICPAYPDDGGQYGGSFVRTRAEGYAAAGLSVAVCVVSNNTLDCSESVVGGIPVWRSGPAGLARVLQRSDAATLSVHHPQPYLWGPVERARAGRKILATFHGYECRPWRTLESSYSAEEITRLSPKLDARDAARRALLQRLLPDPDITCIFVSDFLRRTAEDFAGVEANAPHIIHNPILARDFPTQVKRPEQRFDILWVRSFNSHNYSNDLARNAVLALSEMNGFDRYRIRIFGDGPLFENSVAPLRGFSNIEINRGFVEHARMRELHAGSGLMLVPSRWESQGLTCGEAMRSGLVPVTTRVAALPEFVDESCAVLADAEDARGLADGIARLARNPDRFSMGSAKASCRAELQCGFDATIGRELSLMPSWLVLSRNALAT